MDAPRLTIRHQRLKLRIIPSVSFGDLQLATFVASGQILNSANITLCLIFFYILLRDISSGKGKPRIGLTCTSTLCTNVLLPVRSVPTRGTKDKQIDKQIDKPSPHIRSRCNWEHVLIGARHAHTDPLSKPIDLLSRRARLDVASGMQISTLIYMSIRHSAMHV